jgi:hypothetical protein
MIKTDVPEEFRFFEVAEELEEVRPDQGKTRLVCVAVNISENCHGCRQVPRDPDRPF